MAQHIFEWLVKIVLSVIGSQILIALARVWLGQSPADYISTRLRIRHPKRLKGVVRWSLVAVIVLIFWGSVFLLTAAGRYWQPHEGEHADPGILFERIMFFERVNDNPFHGLVLYRTIPIAGLIDACLTSHLEYTSEKYTQAELKTKFDKMIFDVDRGSRSGECSSLPATGKDIQVDPIYARRYISDAHVEGMKQSVGFIYMFMTMLYKIPGSEIPRVTQLCYYVSGGLEQRTQCDGDFNRTFYHATD
jgi:hypothetical protein